jgi:hypothetical protein
VSRACPSLVKFRPQRTEWPNGVHREAHGDGAQRGGPRTYGSRTPSSPLISWIRRHPSTSSGNFYRFKILRLPGRLTARAASGTAIVTDANTRTYPLHAQWASCREGHAGVPAIHRYGTGRPSRSSCRLSSSFSLSSFRTFFSVSRARASFSAFAGEGVVVVAVTVVVCTSTVG